MFIDIHGHTRRILGPRRHGKQAYSTPEELLQRYTQLQIEQAVLLPGVSPEAVYMPQSNEEILLIANEHPGRFIPFCNIDPRALTNSPFAPFDELLRHYQARGCKGVGEVIANLPLQHPLVQNLLRHVEATGLPLTFHLSAQLGGLYGLYDDPGLPQLERCLQTFPGLKFFAHSQVFWAEMGQLEKPADRYSYPRYPVKEGVVPKLFRQYPNLYGDLSANSGYNALARDPAYAIQFMTEFQDRLLFGTDMTAPDTPTPLVDFLLHLKDTGQISPVIFNKIARENAIRILNLAGD